MLVCLSACRSVRLLVGYYTCLSVFSLLSEYHLSQSVYLSIYLSQLLFIHYFLGVDVIVFVSVVIVLLILILLMIFIFLVWKHR